MGFVRLLVLLSLCFAGSPAAARPGAAGLKPGSVFRDCRGCPEMVVIPAGDFLMGAPDDEPGAWRVEKPQHRVAIKALAAGRFDITRKQWAAFAAETKRPTSGGCAYAGAETMSAGLDPQASWKNLFPQGDDHPVVCVTWGDAQDYAAWLSRRTGHRYRLPSEAEWEYAARAGTTTAYDWGAEASHDRANYGEEKCCTGLAAGRDRWIRTSPVGAFPPNAFGLYDTHGNVMQWVQDCLYRYEDGRTDGSAFEDAATLPADIEGGVPGTSACAYRMLRGGDWGNPPRMIRSASRNYAPAPGLAIEVYRSGGLGIRVVRDLD